MWWPSKSLSEKNDHNISIQHKVLQIFRRMTYLAKEVRLKKQVSEELCREKNLFSCYFKIYRKCLGRLEGEEEWDKNLTLLSRSTFTVWIFSDNKMYYFYN